MIKKWLFVGVLIGGLFSQASFAGMNADGLLGAVTGCMGEGSAPSPDDVVSCLSKADVPVTDARLVAIAYVLMVPLGSNNVGDCYTTGQLNLAGSLISNAVTFDKLGSQISTDLAESTCADDPDHTLASLVPGTKKLAQKNRNFATILKTAFKQSFSYDQCLFGEGKLNTKDYFKSYLTEDEARIKVAKCSNAKNDALAVWHTQGASVVDALSMFLDNHTDIENEGCCVRPDEGGGW